MHAHVGGDGCQCSTARLVAFLAGFHGTWREAGCNGLQCLLSRTEGFCRRAHAVLRVVAVELWCGHWLYTRNSYKSAPDATEVVVASSIAAFEHVHDRAHKSVAVFDQLAITGKVERLEEQAEPSLDKNLISVEAEGEAELALVKKLYDLDHVFASIAGGDDG